MTTTTHPAHGPSTLERVAVLEHLVHLALDAFDGTEPGILWDALVDARASLGSAFAVVTAVHLGDDPATTAAGLRPSLVCGTCGAHLDADVDPDFRDYVIARARHESGSCSDKGNSGTEGTAPR